MPTCKRCGQAIEEDDSTLSRNEWCLSMRRLLVLHDILPDDYHRKCFIDVLMGKRRRASLSPGAAIQAQDAGGARLSSCG